MHSEWCQTGNELLTFDICVVMEMPINWWTSPKVTATLKSEGTTGYGWTKFAKNVFDKNDQQMYHITLNINREKHITQLFGFHGNV